MFPKQQKIKIDRKNIKIFKKLNFLLIHACSSKTVRFLMFLIKSFPLISFKENLQTHFASGEWNLPT